MMKSTSAAVQLPGQHACVGKQVVRNLDVFLQVDELAEEDGKDRHHRQRLQDRPGDADRRLLVTYLDVTPGQKIGQFAVTPELPEVEEAQSARRLEHHRPTGERLDRLFRFVCAHRNAPRAIIARG